MSFFNAWNVDEKLGVLVCLICVFNPKHSQTEARDHRMIRVRSKTRRQAPSWGETARAARRIRVSQRRLTAVGAAGAQLAGGRREERRLT